LIFSSTFRIVTESMKILILTHPSMSILEKHRVSVASVSKKVTVVTASDSHRHTDAEVIITSQPTVISLRNFPHLKWIHVTSAGVNAVPDEIMRSSVLLTNSSGVHPIPIAEQVFGYMLMFSRSLHRFHRIQIEKGTWTQDRSTVGELSGKTIGILGIGRIGTKIAALAKAFGMSVLPFDRKRNNLKKVMKESDFVVNCLPATKDTYRMLDKTILGLMKKTTVFINIGRGDTVDEAALIKLLEKNKIAGAGLDVFEQEPLPSSSKLWKLPNVVLTPHSAGSTPHYTDRVIEIFCTNLRAYLRRKPMPTLVDKKKGY
jgi:D-2-hydroxyacid dehydrogenase (NADP+)